MVGTEASFQLGGLAVGVWRAYLKEIFFFLLFFPILLYWGCKELRIGCLESDIMGLFCSWVYLIGMPGGWELVLIVFAILLLFGAKKIPELARGIGRGIREFKDATREVNKEIEQADNIGKDSKKSGDGNEASKGVRRGVRRKGKKN